MGSLKQCIFRQILLALVLCRSEYAACPVLGPPGSGKSFVLKRIIQVLKESDKVPKSFCRKYPVEWFTGAV